MRSGRGGSRGKDEGEGGGRGKAGGGGTPVLPGLA